ncbi:PREDICTED: E3 ubiquitin-protein ligase At1g63170 [Tarenaya hassleriana]|uniref:E3 ubiquitin-protein ligase At1g63170 n=1 Tax=Tarenaya hassleriana TaxID=28532 RepID=UPI00053C26BE|nr:PREDICTED: E3 ubiquitin-protein ligase At1g63170 [Tarenaya hassleriana]XP_010537939.1 PREDICTED: E3 ubiquitin-protein ligase At1g63170 [Tarenaya hassleriana]
MDASSVGSNRNQADQDPLLMERETHNDREHIIDITSNDEDSSSRSSIDEQTTEMSSHQGEERVSSSSIEHPTHLPLSSPQQRLNPRHVSSSRRGGDGHGRLSGRSPLNSGLWISVELIVTVGQIVAAIVVLALARDEHPQAPLFTWVFGYTSGCIATLPILYWRFCNYNQEHTNQDSSHRGGSSLTNNSTESTPYAAVSMVHTPDEETNTRIGAEPRNHQGENLRARLNGLVDHFKMALDCFFAVWFVVGNVWIFGGHSSPSDAPKLYRLCIVFLTFSCIGYAMPFILCATICCCLPCLISVLGFRENFSQTRGAAVEVINALPVYKFRLKSVNDEDLAGEGEGGFLLSGSQKKCLISGEDAVCCICLARYADNDELRELPCTHVFHVECVDKWLKINATCPLCKSEIGESSGGGGASSS